MNKKSNNGLTGLPSIDQLHKKGGTFLENHPIIPSVSIYDAYYLISKLEKRDDAIECDGLKVSTNEFISDVAIMARALKELGVKKQQVVSTLTPNIYQTIVTFFACNKIGAVCVPLNNSFTLEETKKYINLFESPLLVTFGRDFETQKKIKLDTSLKNIISITNADVTKKGFKSINDELVGYSDFIDYSNLGNVAKFYKKPINAIHKGSDEALYSFTSGTTGQPKVVVLTNENIISCGLYQKNTCHITSNHGTRRSLACVPFCYPYGFSTSVLAQMLDGIGIILAPNINKNNISYYLQKNPNIVFGSPALLEMAIKYTPDYIDLSNLEYFISGGDFLQESQYRNGVEFLAKHNSKGKISNGFGNAETVSCTTMPIGVEHKPETVGKLMYGSDAIVVNPDTMEELKYGEEGLLCVTGKHVFKEYYKDPQRTADAKFQYKGKTYFNTGTMGILREDGYFVLSNRASRFYINDNLNKIYCDYVQNIITKIDVVDSCALVPVSDPERLYVGKAYIVLKKGVDPNEETLKYIQNMLLSNFNTKENPIMLKEYEIPASIEFVEELPRTLADKIDYKALEEKANEEAKSNIRKLILQ